jgi:hypothetical protein
MQIVSKLLIGVIILIAAFLAFSSKKEKNVIKGDRIPSLPQHTYYYYPMANFYYDSTEGNYILWDSATAVWKKTNKLPFQVDLGKTVRIGEASEPVWKENQHHRLIYSVSLYSGPKDFKKEEKVVVKEPVKSDTTAQQKTEKKRGVRKFFERIFPPRKKTHKPETG